MKAEEKKYYLPEIGEIHVGFECEASIATATSPQNVKTKWEKITIGGSSKFDNLIKGEFLQNGELEEGLLRVKYLDKEDIESEEFVHEGGALMRGVRDSFILNDLFRIEHVYKSHFTSIFKMIDDVPHTIFEGIIKNKSQLKQILSWTGILK